MRKLLENRYGNVGTIIMAVTVAIVMAISILITYSVLSGIDVTNIDSKLPGDPAKNATGFLLNSLGTFYSIAPIYLVVLIAVAIIGAVMGIMIVRRR